MKTRASFPSVIRFILCCAAFSYTFNGLCQQTSAHRFIRWQLTTAGKTWLTYEDSSTLYFTSQIPAANEVILAVSSVNGSLKWTYRNEKPMVSVIGRAGNLLYVHAGGSFGGYNITVALNANSGKSLWHIRSADRQQQSQLMEGVFLIQYGGLDMLAAATLQQALFGKADELKEDDLHNKIIALDYTKGKELWRIDLDRVGGPYSEEEVKNILWSDGQLCIRGNVLFFSTEEYLAAADITNGRLLWVNTSCKKQSNEQDIIPQIDGRKAVFGGQEVTAVDLVNGQSIWSFPLDSLESGRLLAKTESALLVEVVHWIDPLRSDSANYSLLALNWRTGEKMWQIPVENEISNINKAGNLAQLKINNSIQLIDLLNGRTKTRIDLGDLKIWPSTDGKFLLSGGIDSVVSLLRPDGTLIDTLHLPAPIEQVSASRFFPFLIVTLQSGDVFILEDPSTNPHTNPLKQTAEKNILQTSIQPLPPRRNIRPSRKNTREISFDNRLRDKRYGLSCENISAQLCTKTGCSPVTHYRSFGLSYKKYYERFWALQLELYLLNRGAKGFKKNQIDQYEYKLRYLNFNCLGEIGTNANRKLRLYLVLGPYYAFPLNAQYDVTRQSGTVEHYDFTSRHDFGAVGGLGLDLDLRKVFFFAEYRVRDSFRPLVNEPPTPGATLSKGKLSSVGFTVGLGIGL